MTVDDSDDPAFRHGIGGYRKGCRCEVCVDANYEAQKRWRDKQRGQPVPARVHGTVNGAKVYGCHCGRCTEARRVSDRRHRLARRRLRVLAERGLPRDYEGKL